MTDELEVANACFERSEFRREAEMLPRRRRAAPVEVAILTVTLGKLEVGEVKIYILWLVGVSMAQR